MSAGYDPFKYADNFNSYEEYMEELKNDEKTRINQIGRKTDDADIEQQPD